MRNRFFLWGMHDAVPSEFVPGEGDQRDPDLRYFLGVARELDRMLADRGLTVLLTWHLDRFEERFRDSIVILVNDEQYQLPSYAGRVRAIFKTGGVRRNPWRTTLALPPAVASRTVLREARNIALTYRRRVTVRQSRGAPVLPVPLGFFRLEDVPHVPFDDRPVDVFFAGSAEHKPFTVRPRLAARWQMAAALEDSRRRLPDLRVDFTNGGPFANPGSMLPPDAYSARLMRARIVLCPRGNIDETYRLMESARSGCVAITECLPDRWYYEHTPAIQLRRWDALPEVLRGLLADPEALARRAEAMRVWWADSLSEGAVASYVSSHVSLGHPDPSTTAMGTPAT